MARKAISKKNRFEVFKRDSFQCQYCGQSAPDVILEIDHIAPVSKGGSDDITNLITSCFDCNRGKSDRTIDDNSVISKQKRQLDELNERRNQLEMMMEWRKSLKSIDEDKAQIVKDEFEEATNATVTESGMKSVQQWVKKYELNTLLDALEKSVYQYADSDVGKAFGMIPKIAYHLSNPQNEDMTQIFYIRGIARNKCDYFDDTKALILLKKAYEVTGDIEILREAALGSRNWSTFSERLGKIIEGESDGDI